MTLHPRLDRFLRDERGQATAEYILILSVALALMAIVIKRLIKPAYEKLRTFLVARLETALFGKGDFHKFPVGR